MQVYAQTNSALALGLVGLAQFLPSALLIFVGGHVADRYDRRRIVRLCLLVDGAVAAVLAARPACLRRDCGAVCRDRIELAGARERRQSPS